MKRLLELSASTAMAAVAVFVTPAYAQERASAQGEANTPPDGDEIIVTANKREESINDVGLSITALSGEALAEQGIQSPDDLTKVVPGFTYTRSSYGAPVYSVRGVGFNDVNPGAPPTVSVYVDEIPFALTSMAKHSAMDVQRVEVLKGPQGTLYGQNATGGAVNFIANKPTDYMSAGGSLTYSSYDKIETDGYISGPLADGLAARLSFMDSHGGAWQRSTTRDDKLGADRFTAGRLLVEATLGDRVTLLFNANGWVDQSDTQAAQAVGLIVSGRTSQALINAFNQYTQPPTNARDADWDPGVPFGSNDPVSGHPHNGFRQDSRFYQFSLRTDADITDTIRLTSLTAYSNLRYSTFIDVDGLNVTATNAGIYAPSNDFTQEVRLAGDSGPVRWIAGANYEKLNADNYGSSWNVVGSFPFKGAGSLAFKTVESWALFGNADIDITSTLTAVAGIRYSNVDLTTTGCTTDAGFGDFAAFQVARNAAPGTVLNAGDCVTLDDTTRRPTGLLQDKLDETNVPFRVGLNWKVNPNSLLYVLVSRGFKAQTNSTVGALFSSSLDPVRQESVMAYETGFKLGLGGNAAQLNGAAFLYRYDDKQIRSRIVDPVLGGLNKTINVPESEIRGAELQFILNAIPNFDFNASAAYTDTKIIGPYSQFTQGGAFIDLGGTDLPQTPKFQFSADAAYNASVSNSAEAFFGAHVHHQTGVFSGLGAESTFKTNTYTNVDIRAGIASQDDNWRVTLFADNVFNEYSWNNVSTAGPDTIVRLVNKPRIIGVRFGFRFE